jgi:hypothetical protein
MRRGLLRAKLGMFSRTLQRGSGTTRRSVCGEAVKALIAPRQFRRVRAGSHLAGYVTADMVMAGLADLMTPHPSPPRRVIVPDLRGLFMRSCLRVVGDLGLQVEMVQLTENPMPVEGLVVDQSPPPGSKVHKSSPLTVEIWHPPHPCIISRG